ncbi:hypothetical protein C8A05DRAFT_17238 [Staphylotrichum tortipilum]|uniref:Uncharacterized protein n=1 Tax=Staphylotrichum tortipilum TaxID=2831512 RepID=A0AAN6RRT9_9PEZI|nr:hypothetical protein C8A05DRAFT_17238 [Staphylotrichum longicolle]
MTSIARPMDSPLPPVPSTLGGPPASIPRRRPVAAPVTVTPTLAPAPAYTTPASTPSFTTTPARTTAPALAIPEPEPSPVGSFSSLFSAYSNHTDDDPRTSPTNPAKDVVSSGNSYSVVSPTLGAQRSGALPGAPTYALAPTSSDQNASDLGHRDRMLEELPPPPPLKDVQRGGSRPGTPTTGLHIQTAQPAASAATSTLPGPQLTGGSPQQDRLWRRRSRSLKADKGFAVQDLKLVSSHGSTAASAQDSSQSSPSSLFSQPFPLPPARANTGSSEAALTPRAPPRSAIGGLPGRNIRPVQDEQVTPRDANMGQEASKIKETVQTARRGGSGEVPKIKSNEALSSRAAATLAATTMTSTLSAVSPLSAKPLPTPEYAVNDVKSTLPASAVSPLSPATSPEIPEPKSAIQPTTQPTIKVPEAQIRHARSTPSLTLQPGNPGLGVRSPMGLPSSPRPGMKQVPHQKQYVPYSPPADRNQTSARTSATSRESQERPLPGPPREEAPPAGPQLGHHISPSQSASPWSLVGPGPIRDPNPGTISETGSIETVKATQLPPQQQQPQQQQQQQQQQPPTAQPLPDFLPPLREPDPNEPDTTSNPGAARFPRGWYTPLPSDAIPDARPLTERQFRCLTGHRYMTANKQRTNPVACRVCGHKDRWAECLICSACHLNVCGACNGVLRRVKGDLKAAVEERRGKGEVRGGEEERGRERVRAGE